MIATKDIILRDFIESDIEKRIYWETVQTEWQLWDAPWEYEGLTEIEKQEELENYIQTMRGWVARYKQMPADQKRYQFQIVINDEEQNYIGWVSAYDIDDDCNYTDEPGHCTVGIDIPAMAARGKGYGYRALGIFIHYLLEHGEKEIFTQTWSGNERMIHLAEKMGFEEYRRKPGIRAVRGGVYDGLTFKLDIEKFRRFYNNGLL